MTRQRHFRAAWCLLPLIVVGITLSDSGAPRARFLNSSPPEWDPNVPAFSVPYPGSTDPQQVVANIRVIEREARLFQGLEIPASVTDRGLRARRVLRVKVDHKPMSPGYLVVELDDADGRPLAEIAMMANGNPVMAQPADGDRTRRPLELRDAASRVQTKRGRAPLSAEYVYFHNIAERGLSYCQPLVAVTTERGVIYLNAKGEAFIEETSALQTEFQSAEIPDPLPELAHLRRKSNHPSVKRLRIIGQW